MTATTKIQKKSNLERIFVFVFFVFVTPPTINAIETHIIVKTTKDNKTNAINQF